jgi:hypothetical protein
MGMYKNVSVEFNSFDRDDLMTARTLLRAAMDILDHDTGAKVTVYKTIVMDAEKQVSKVITKIDDAVDGE